MQSYLQYRRFNNHLKQQIAQHGLEKVASVSTIDAPVANSRGPRRSRFNPGRIDEEKLSDEERTANNSISHESSHEPKEPIDEHDFDRTPTHHASSNLNAATSHSAESDESRADNRDHQDVEATAADADRTSTGIASRPTQSHADTSYSLQETGTRLGQQMTGVSVRSQDAKHQFVVGFQGDDDNLNPHNWSNLRRVAYTLLVASIALVVGFASSVDSAAIPQLVEDFRVSEVVASLGTGLYLVGFGFGAFTAGPISETVGRNPVYLVTGVLFMIFIMASALSPNIGAYLVFRLLAGFFGSTPLTCAGGSISDMWNAEERTGAFPVFANAAFWGPVIGPILGGFIGESFLGWRWCDWISLIWAGLVFGICFLFLPETFAPVLLKWKAEHLRKLTNDQRYMSELETQESTFMERVLHALYRPWLLLFFEPIAILFTLYLTVVYIILFTFLTGYEFIFEETYGLSQGLTFLIFVSIGVGFLLASTLVPFVVKRYNRSLKAAQAQGKAHLPPEQRLVFAMIGAPFLPIGLFWLAWTCYPSVSIWSPIVANVPVGFAILCIFISTYQYLIDSFEKYAASALVGVTFVRYLAAGGMIPVSIPFYKNVGRHWVLTFLALLALVLAPVPYIFYIYGARIRKSSRHAVAQ